MALGALVVLDHFECNGFVAVRFGIKGVLCKENRSNTLRTSRVHCTRPASLYTARTRPVVYVAGRPMGPCTRSLTARYGRLRPVTAVYTARSQPVHGSVYGRV